MLQLDDDNDQVPGQDSVDEEPDTDDLEEGGEGIVDDPTLDDTDLTEDGQ